MKVKETIIVEGEHDKRKLLSFLEADILVTDGFSVFHDKDMKNLIKKLSEKKGVILLTDSDRAGFIIRNHLKNIAPNVKHAYIPEIKGKERRKQKPGKEGLLGVEGIDKDIIIKALIDCGAQIDGRKKESKQKYTQIDLYNLGYIGKEDSRIKRREFLLKNGLPQKLNTKMMLEIINALEIELF